MASASKSRKSDQKTNAATAWSILAALKKPFSDRDKIWPIRRRIRLRQEDPPIPEAYHGTALKHKSAELDWAVRQIVALLSENREQYIIYATDDTQNMQRLADECQKSVSALMEMLEDQHPIERPRALCHDYQVADGVCAEKFSFDWDFFKRVKDSKGDDQTWRDALTAYVKEHKELPLRKVALDPFTLYWEFDINGLVAVAEHSRARRSALIDEYEENKSVMNALARLPVYDASGLEGSEGNSTTSAPGTGGDTYSDAGETLTVLEVWTRKEFFLVAENGGGERQTLIRQKHPFKRPPYFFGAGILTGSQNPLHQFQPLVLPLYPLSLELSAVRTARLNAAFLSSFKPFYVKYNAGTAEDEESGNLKIHFLMPGSSIPSLKGGEIVPIQWTNLEELEKMEQSLMADRERFGFQAILSGQSIPSGESTAWATRMMRDQGMVQFNGVLRNYAQMREEEVRFVMDLVRDVLKQDLPVSRRVLDTKRKRGHIQTLYLTKEMCEVGFDVQCRLTAGKAADRISIVEEFRRAKEAGEVPTRMVLEEGWQFENATEIQDEVLDEQIRMQLLPKAMELIVTLAAAGAEEELMEPEVLSPEEAAMQQEQAMMEEQQQAEMMAQQQAQMDAQATAMQQANMPMPPGQQNPLSGEIPGGVAEAGLQQGLQSPEIPPDEPYGVLLQ